MLAGSGSTAFSVFFRVTGNIWVLEFGDEMIFVIEKTLIITLVVRLGHFIDGRDE